MVGPKEGPGVTTEGPSEDTGFETGVGLGLVTEETADGPSDGAPVGTNVGLLEGPNEGLLVGAGVASVDGKLVWGEVVEPAVSFAASTAVALSEANSSLNVVTNMDLLCSRSISSVPFDWVLVTSKSTIVVSCSLLCPPMLAMLTLSKDLGHSPAGIALYAATKASNKESSESIGVSPSKVTM